MIVSELVVGSGEHDKSERTKQMEPILRAKVKKIWKNAFSKKWWAYRVYIRQKKIWGGCHHLLLVYDASNRDGNSSEYFTPRGIEESRNGKITFLRDRGI